MSFKGKLGQTLALSTTVLLVAPLGSQAMAAAWKWSLIADGVDAAGTFETTDATNADGFVEITSISGFRNGVAVTGLQPAGTAVPGNAGYPVDNLLRADGIQLTGKGFGYRLADGSYSNPFYADFETPPANYEYFSFPPFGADSHTEIPVMFSASLVPEPATWFMFASGLVAVGITRRRRNCALLLAWYKVDLTLSANAGIGRGASRPALSSSGRPRGIPKASVTR